MKRTRETVTIRDIAAKAGVSVSLVSCVMNNYALENGKDRYRVNSQTKEKILRIAKEMNYEPNMAARILRGGNSHVIGAILADISNVYYGEIAKNFEDIFFKKGYTLWVASTEESPEKFDKAVNSFISKGVDGIVAFPCEGSLESLKKIEDSGIPLVTLCRYVPEIKAPAIVIDGVSAIRKSMDILHGKGIDNIRMLSYTMRVSSILERERGFIEGFYGPDADLRDSDRIFRMRFDNVEDDVERFISDHIDDTDGIVTATNALAMAAIKSIMRHKKKVQKDVFIVGFDEDNAYSVFEPPIPHVVQPTKEMCRHASEELLSIIEKHSPQSAKRIVLQCDMVGIEKS